jgi:hypothetical protein
LHMVSGLASDDVEARLGQRTTVTELFTIR